MKKPGFILSRLLLLFTCSVFIISCTKTGPAGPQGPEGPAGGQGPVGSQGPQGPAGTANVIYSQWASFVSTNWSPLQGAFGREYRITLPSNVDAQTIQNQGAMLVYVQNLPPTIAYASSIPATGYFNNPPAGSPIQTLRFAIDTRLSIFFSNIANTDPGILFNTSQYRYIIIPGGITGGRIASGPAAGYTKEQLMAMTYEQVAKLLGIKD